MATHHEDGYRERHLSVANYQMGDGGRRRSSVVAAPVPASESRQLSTRDDTLRKMSVAVPNLAEVISDAKLATELERKMSFREGCKLYPKAILFSFILSLAVIMEGYDTAIVYHFFGMQQFAQRYGQPVGDGTYQLPAKWQNALSNGVQVGSIIGLFLNGIISERIGYRKTMIGSLILIISFIFINFFAQNIETLLAGYILCGIPWGVFQTLTTTYAAEVTPVALRAYLTTYVNLCWVIGQFIAAGVLRAMESNESQWAYRIPYAVQWIWPVPIIIGVLFAPESPWWLVRHGRLDDARQALTRLTSPKNTEFNLEDTLAMMIHTNEMEIQQTAGASYLACLKGVNLRRTEIVCLTWMIQTFCGSPLIGHSVYFMQQAGLSQTNSFSLNIGQTAMAFVGTVGSWFLMPHFGRRTLYLAGQIALFILLLVIGGIACATPQTTSMSWGTGALLLVFTFLYDITVGPVCYALVAEMPSTRLRIKSVVIARSAYNVVGIFVNVVQPNMLNPTAWNWKGKTAFFWAGTGLCCLIWTYFRLPEPKGLTYGELDVLFEHKISARKFRKVDIDPFRSENLTVVSEENVSDHDVSYEKKG